MHFGLKANIDFKFSAKGQNVIENETWGAVRLHQDTQLLLLMHGPSAVRLKMNTVSVRPLSDCIPPVNLPALLCPLKRQHA